MRSGWIEEKIPRLVDTFELKGFSKRDNEMWVVVIGAELRM